MGSLPEGGIFAVDTTNRFFEMTIPKDAPGLNGTDNFMSNYLPLEKVVVPEHQSQFLLIVQFNLQ